MSVVKFDLSNSSIERNELSAVIDSLALLAKLKSSDLYKLIEENEEIYWTGQAEEYFEKELGFIVVASGNTYNHESDLSEVLQWSIMTNQHSDNDLYSNGILLVQLHHGGDPRGNYGNVAVYKWEGEDTLFFLDAVAGYYVTDLQGERIDNNLTQHFESGYSANPGYQLSKHIVKIVDLTEEKATVELDDGSTVVVYPEHSANYN